MSMSRIVIGVGNAFRRDDGAGIAVTRRLAGENPEAVVIREESGEGTSLMAAWEGQELAILVDASRSGAQPGTVRRFDAAHDRLPSGLFHYSSHTFSVAEAVEMARTLERLPGRLIVYGIEGSDFAYGEGLTEPVASAVEEVVEMVCRDLQLP